MSRASLQSLKAGAVVLALSGVGCWEQVDADWFAQMKEQPAVQALEHVEPLVPPDGTIPVGGIEPRIHSAMPSGEPAAKALRNPLAPNATSLASGQRSYEIYCSVCHGKKGLMGDGATVGPRVAAIPLARVPTLSDGEIFTKIRYGKPLMPGYPQIRPEDRWHIVNYLKHKLFPGGTGE